ncbi:hypothetical protein COE27_31575, partial [Bacillus cereus]
DEETDIKHTLNPHLMYFVYDNKTEKMIEEFKDVKNIYDIKIRPGMNIEINTPEISEDFQGKSNLFIGGEINETNGLNNDRCYTIKPNAEISTKEINIKNEYVYLVMFDIKAEGDGIKKVDLLVNHKERFGEINCSNEYKRNAIILNTFDKKEEGTKIVIKSHSKKPIYIDNFSVINLGHQYDLLRQENKDLSKVIKEGNSYRIPIKTPDMNQFVYIINKKLFVLPPNQQGTHTFRFEYVRYKGAFYIISTTTYPIPNLVLTWEEESQKLIFTDRKKKIDSRQLWYLTQIKNGENAEGYKVISCYDRSKVLDYSLEKPIQAIEIKLETIDHSKNNQLFLKKLEGY